MPPHRKPYVINKFLLFLLIVSNVLSGQRVATFISEGDLAMKLGNWNAAINMYSSAIDIDNTDAKAYIKRARVYEITGNGDLAKLDYERAIFHNPFARVYYLNKARLELLGKNFYGAGENPLFNPINEGILTFTSSFQMTERMLRNRYIDAFDNLESRLRVGEGDTDVYLRDALLLFNRGDYQEAIVLIGEMKANSDVTTLMYDLEGLILLHNGGIEDAIDAFTQAIMLQPHYSQAYQNRAYAYVRMGNMDHALKDYEMAISLDRDQADLHFQRGLVFCHLGRYESALQDFSKARQLEPDFSQATFNWIFTLMLTGKYTDAYFHINNRLNENPRDPSSYYLRASLYFIYGDYTKAINDFTLYLDHFPNDPYAIFNRGMAYILKNQVITGCNELIRSFQGGFLLAEEVNLAFCRV
ncbi:MAG TPA: tetratricopeptide repeat protein [Saprospiraceae bacterium]|nr:tetratricopeptide repeat protein [Saprospiraceae bacterium]